MKYFSMFSGIGGFDLALNRQGQFCVGFSEIDKYAIKVYNKHFKEVINYGDATKIIPEQLPDFDLLVGGFPCQAFSIAGKRRGFEDTRGTLFYEIARIVRCKRPRYLLLENVKGLVNHNQGETFRIILETLRELGYIIDWGILNSRYFGVPQNRERVFIIGSLAGERRPKVFPLRKINGENHTALKEMTINTPDAQRVYDSSGIAKTLKGLGGGQGAKTGLYAVHNMQPRSPDRPSLKYSSGGSGHLSRPDTAYCLDSGNTNGVETEPMKIRRLTPVECARLQGFPDDWHEGLSDTQAYKCYGNAVTVNVIEAIMRCFH